MWEREINTCRQADGRTNADTEGQSGRRAKEVGRARGSEGDAVGGRERERSTDRLTERQTDIETDRQKTQKQKHGRRERATQTETNEHLD